jgi:hypothetical protein
MYTIALYLKPLSLYGMDSWVDSYKPPLFTWDPLNVSARTGPNRETRLKPDPSIAPADPTDPTIHPSWLRSRLSHRSSMCSLRHRFACSTSCTSPSVLSCDWQHVTLGMRLRHKVHQQLSQKTRGHTGEESTGVFARTHLARGTDEGLSWR